MLRIARGQVREVANRNGAAAITWGKPSLCSKALEGLPDYPPRPPTPATPTSSDNLGTLYGAAQVLPWRTLSRVVLHNVTARGNLVYRPSWLAPRIRSATFFVSDFGLGTTIDVSGSTFDSNNSTGLYMVTSGEPQTGKCTVKVAGSTFNGNLAIASGGGERGLKLG